MAETMKKKMDEKTRKLMEGICPFNISSTVEYTPDVFKRLPAEYRPKFVLRPLRAQEIKEFRKSLTALGLPKEEDESAVKDALRMCITNIKNYFDAGTGEAIEYKQAPDGGMDKDLYDTVPYPIVVDLVGYLTKISGLADIEKQSL